MVRVWDTNLNAYRDAKTIRRYDQELQAFVDVEAVYTTINGVKRQVWPNKLYLYKDGDECVGVTGGWGIKLNYYGAADMKNTNGCFDSGKLTTSKGNAVFTTNVIDVSRYSKMCAIIDFERNDARLHSLVMALFKIRPSAWEDTPYSKMAELCIANTTQALSGTRFLAQFDISGVKEPGYAMLMANCWFPSINGTYNSHTKIYEVWLEI